MRPSVDDSLRRHRCDVQALWMAARPPDNGLKARLVWLICGAGWVCCVGVTGVLGGLRSAAGWLSWRLLSLHT